MANKNNNRHFMGTPGVPMLYQPAKMDVTFSNELAARLSREYTRECIERLAEHMRDDLNPTVSLAATNALLDRAYGKPKELKELTGPGGSVPRLKVEVEFIDVIDQAPRPVKSESRPLTPDFVD